MLMGIIYQPILVMKNMSEQMVIVCYLFEFLAKETAYLDRFLAIHFGLYRLWDKMSLPHNITK
jgi:hypothetical protein